MRRTELGLVWGFGFVAAAGFLLGLRHRAPALIVATGLLLALSLVAFVVVGPGWRVALIWLLGSALSLQFAYLLGAAARVRLERKRGR